MVEPSSVSETFLREVDEELRRDQVLGFWKNWGRKIVVAMIGALVLLAGWLWWSAHRKEEAGVEGEVLSGLVADISEGRTAGSTAKIDTLAQSNVKGYAIAARMIKADLASEKDRKGAAAQFAAIAADTSLDDAYRNLALVKQTALEFDTMKPEDVIARLKPLAVPGNPYFGSAGEMTGIAYLRMGKPDLANGIFNAMAADEQVPEGIRSRVVQLTGTTVTLPKTVLDDAPAAPPAATTAKGKESK